MRLLAVVATEQERAALLRDVAAERLRIGPYAGSRTPCADVVVSGIGPAASAAATATALALGSYDVALSTGICGAFRGTAELGAIVVATELVCADLGADSPSGFLTTGALGWAEDTVPVDPDLLTALVDRLGSFRRPGEAGPADETAPAQGAEVVTGPVLTVSTVTGTKARADELAARHGAAGEAMEGWGVLVAATPHGTPVLEVRAVSNVIGDRDPSTWDFGRAFDSLARVGAQLLEEPWR